MLQEDSKYAKQSKINPIRNHERLGWQAYVVWSIVAIEEIMIALAKIKYETIIWQQK